MTKILTILLLVGFTIGINSEAKAQGATCGAATALTSGTALTAQTITDVAGTAGGDCGSADSATGSTAAGCAYGWYSITTTGAQTIEVALNVTSGATQDARLEIYSGTCAALVLEDCDRQTNTSDGLVSYIAPVAGTYYIRVTDFGCSGNVTFEIKATLTGAPCGATALTSDTALTGETITDVTAVSGTVGTGSGGDCAASADNDDYVTPLTDIAATVGCGYKWYSITAASAQTIEVAVNATSGATQDIRVDLYQGVSCSSLTRVDCQSPANSTSDAFVSYIAPTAGTYYIRVTDFNCNANVTYEIKATLTGAACSAPTLSAGTTSGLTLTDVTAVSGTVGAGSGGICATTDYNNPPTAIVGCGYTWHTFSAAANTPVEVSLATATGARIELFSGSSCTSFTPRDCAAGTNPSVTYTSATATTYWVRVTDTDCNANLTYSLNLAIIQNVLATTGTQTINMDCGTTYNFYDSGGPGGDGTALYGNGINSNVTFTAPAGQSVRVTFKNVWRGNIGYCSTGNGYNAIRIDNGQTGSCSVADYLTIYDGAIGSNNVGVYTGTTAFYPSPGTVVSSGSSLSFNFTSGTAGAEEGWEAVVECVPDIVENTTDITIDCGLGDVFTDDAFNAGGNTNIQPNDQYVVTYCPGTPGYCAFVGALSGTATLNLNDNSDVLYVYNSDQATGSPVAVLTGGDPNVSNGVACGGAAANSNTITGITAFLANNPNGCLTFKFVSSNSTKDPSWTPRSGWSLPIECVECDLGNGGGTEVSTATPITSNGFWAGTSINDTGNSDSGFNTGCNDAGTDFVLNSTGCLESEITRLENTIWYKLVTPAAMCLANDPIVQVNYVNCQNYSSGGSGTNAGNGIQFVLWEMTPSAGNVNFTAEGDQWDNNNNGVAVGNNNMIYCEDKVTAGEFVDVPCLKPNTTYYIMVDGFTGQHCFFDMYIDVFPADLTAAPALVPSGGICSGGTFNITQSAKREVEFVWSTTNLTDRNQIYNLSGGPQSIGVGYTSDGVTYTYNDASLPTNTGCNPITYYIYAIDANFPESAGFCGTDYQSAACRPYQMTPMIVYPTPPISNIVTDCSFNIDPNCGALNSNFVVEYSADGVTGWTPEGAGVPPTPTAANNYGYYARVRHTSSPSDCGTPTQVFGVGCATSCTVIPPTVFSNSPICVGQTLNLNASTVASATGYSWSGPNGFTSTVQNPSIVGASTLATGTYTVTVTNSAIPGCTATATLSVVVNPTPTVSALSIAAICPGSTPAILNYTASTAGTITVSSGTATINTQTYSVASGAGTVNIALPTTVTNGQTVSVTLTANGCPSVPQTVAIPVHPAPDANFPTPAPVCEGSPMSFDASTSTAGAGSISTYAWNFGDGTTGTGVTTTHTFPASGTYNVSLQITTSNGCTNTESKSVTVVPNPDITNIAVTQPTCATATGGVSFNVPTPATDYEYQIDAGSFTAITANPTSVSSLAVGAHTVTVRRIAAPQCTATINFTLIAASGCGATCTAPGMTLTNTDAAVCQSAIAQTVNYQYTALANGSTGVPNSYDLTQVFGAAITGLPLTNQTLAVAPPNANISIGVPAGTAAGTYTFILKIYNNSDATCAAQYPLQLVVNAPPTATLTNDGPKCAGATVNLTATGGSTYAWSAGVTAGAGGAATVATAGTYTVTVTSAAGCTATATTSVGINTTPTLTGLSATPICLSGTATTLSYNAGTAGTLTVSSGTATINTQTYSVANGSGTVDIAIPTTISNGQTVSVTLTANGCSSAPQTVAIPVHSAPDANFTTNSPQCQGTTMTFDATTSTAGAGTITNYSWSFGDGSTATGATATHNYGATAIGTYLISLTITTDNGCANTQTGTIVINPTPVASITGTTTVCQSGTGTPTTTNLTANGGVTYDWSNIAGTNDGATNAGIGAGTYTVTVTSAGCTSTASITVTSIDCTGATNCIVDAGPDPANFCVGTGSSVNLNATPTASGSSGTWTCLNCPTTPTFGSTTSAATTASGLTNVGTYTFVWTVTGATCNGQDNAVVTVYSIPVPPVATGAAYCQGQAIAPIIATGQTGAVFTWYNDAALTAIIDNDASYTPTGAGTVYVTQTVNGCPSPATAVMTTVNPTPNPSFTTDSPACLGEAIVFTNTTTGATTYLWAFGDGTNSIQTSPSHTYTIDGTYTVTVTTTSVNGCVASATGVVVVYALPTAGLVGDNTLCVGEALSLTASGGTSYSWTTPTGPSSANPTYTVANVATSDAGNYVVTVTDGNGCKGTSSLPVTVNDLPTPTIEGNLAVCTATGTTTTLIATGGNQYSWNTGAVSASISSIGAGTYTVTVTNSVTGCSSASTVTVTGATCPVVGCTPPATPTAASPAPICDGEAIPTLSVSGSATGTFTWYANNSGVPGTQLGTGASFTPTLAQLNVPGATTFFVRDVLASPAGCQSEPRAVVVIINSLPTPTIAGNSPICEGGTANLSVNQTYSSYQWSNSGGTSQSATYSGLISATTYTVTVTDGNNCQNTDDYTVVVNPLPTPTAASNSPVCVGANLTLSSSVAGATYAWAGPNGFTATSQNPTITAATAAASGTYTVTVTVAGCSSTTTTDAIVNALPIPAIAGDLVLCSDVAGDQAILTATGGGTYAWSTAGGTILAGAGTATVTVTAAGTYTVVVTNASNCTATTTANVSAVTCGGGTSCSPPTMTLTNTLRTICAPNVDTPVSFPYSATTNNPNTYDLTQVFGTILGVNQSGANLTAAPSSIDITVPAGTTAGTYTFTLKVYDSATASCSGTYAIQINVLPVPSLTVNPPAQICEGTTLNLNNYITGFNGTTGTLAWYEGTDNTGTFLGNSTVTAGTITSTALNVSPSATTQYYVEMQTTPTPSCPSSAGFTINVTPAPMPDFSAVAVCAGSATAFVNATSNTTAGVTYTWNFGDASTSTSTTPTHTYATAGTYLVNLTATNQPGNCSATINKNIVVNPNPTAAIAGDNDLCLGETLTLTASGGTSYSWTTPTGTSSANPYTIASVATSDAGNYVVTVTDANGCQDTEAASVIVRDLPIVSIANTSPICEGGNFSLTASGGTSYQWTLPSALISTANPINVTSATATDAGIYTVTATDANGCKNTATTTAFVNANPIASIAGDNDLCVGEALSLTASAGTSYSWTTPTGTSSANPYTVASVATSDAGNYVVTVTDGNGCQGTTSLPVTVNNLPTPSIINGPAQNICNTAGSTLALTAIGGTAYTWSTADGTISGSSTSQSITATSAGTYVVTVTLNGCTSTSQVVVTATAAACSVTPCTTPVTIANAGNDQTVCLSTGTVNLSANTPIVGTGAWSILSQPAGANAVVSTPSSNNTAVTGLSVAGDYIFTWTISSAIAACPPSVDYIKVSVNPAPVAVISGDNVICANETASFTATGGVSYAWNTGATTATITTSIAGVYSVVVTDSNNCTDTESITLTVNALPTAAINTNSPICAGDDATLTATGGTSYLWTLADASTATNNPLIITNATTIADAGLYSVVVTDANGCTDTEQASIVINSIPANPVAAGGTFCNVADIMPITATGALGAVFTWYSDVNLTTVIDNDATYTPTTAGSVYVTQTVNGCESPATTVTTAITGAPPAPIANGATYCEGENPVALTVLNPAAGATITWYSDNTLITQVGTGISFDAGTTISTTTTYYVTQAIGTCVSPVTPVTITVNLVPAAPSVSSPAPYCAGETIAGITATGTVGATYTWYSDATLTNIIGNSATYTPSGAGTFFVTQTVNGCESPASSATVIVNANPVPVISGNLQVCNTAGSTTTLVASGGTTYLWNTTEATATITAMVGTYTVTVSNTANCEATATATVIANPLACSPGATISGVAFAETNTYDGLSAGEMLLPNVIVGLYDSNGTLVAQTVTNAAGAYQFTNVPAGTYTVGFGTPTDYTVTTADAIGSTTVTDSGDSDINTFGQTQPLTVVAGNNYPNVDAGFVELLNISGTLFGDTDADGQDNNSVNYPNVTVNLLDTNGATIATTTTDPDGNYTFADVLPGNYTVQFDLTDADLPTNNATSPANVGSDVSDSDIDNNGEVAVVVPVGQDVNDIDAGITPLTYALTGTVFEDIMADGLQNGVDPGIKGVTVFLFNASDLNSPLAVDITNNNGIYAFTDLPPGDYVVMVVKANTYSFTDGDADPLNDIDDSDVITISGNNGETAPVSIVNANVTDVDAGMFVPAVINGTAFADLDGDGLNDNGVILPGITVTLADVNGNPVVDADGVPVAPLTTDATGQYEFDNLLPGDYIVTFGTAPGSYEYIPQGGDSDIDPITGSFVVNNLESGDVATVDGGAIQPIFISGTVFTDANGNGLNDQNTPVAGVTATLYDATTNTPVAVTTTDSNGDYTFVGIDPGTYYVDFSDVPSNNTIINPSNDSDANPTTTNTPNVTVTSGSNISDGLDVGIIAPASIVGNVFEDTNYNGLNNENIDVAGITVTLFNANGTPIAVATTDANGNYSFPNLAPGSYYVVFNSGSNYELTVDGGDSDANPLTGTTTPIVLQSGEVGVFDAGVFEPASISGTVFGDDNADGIAQASDTGETGLQVILYNADGTVATDVNGVPQIATTDINGNYVFDNLLPGDYYVQFNNPAGTQFSPQNLGTNGSDAAPSTGQTPTINLVSGEVVTDEDAGIFIPQGVNVSGTVFVDANFNGFQGGTETGIANVPVFLYDAANPLTPIAVTATNGAGNYIFTDVLPGNYIVGYGAPANYTYTTPNATPTDDATDSDVTNIPAQQTSSFAVNNTNVTDLDAGLYQLASISGTLFEDMDGDNLNDNNAPVSGVTVVLLDANGSFVSSTTTDANGDYEFNNIPPGSYTIDFGIIPVGTQFIPQGGDSDVEPANGTHSVSVPSGGTATVDAGIIQPTSISGTVFGDIDNDGQDDNNTDYPSVTVQLLDENGAVIATTTTNASGDYTFNNVLPGNYAVAVNLNDTDLPADFTVSPQDNGDDATDSDISSTGTTNTITVVSGTPTTDVDAGIVPATSIAGTVFGDTDYDGQDDNNVNISNITVYLYNASDLTTPIATTITNASGDYQFTNLAPGTYVVQFDLNDSDLPTAAVPTFPNQGNDANDSDMNPNDGFTAPVTVTASNPAQNIDAGFYNNTILANDDAETTFINTPVTVVVTLNDVDQQDHQFDVTQVVSQPSHGTAVLNPDGTITYTPDFNYTGTDVFTYQICDNVPAPATACDIAVVTITISPDNVVFANPDQDVTLVNVPVTTDPATDNDEDPTNDNFDITEFTQPNNGTVVLNPDNTFTYTPDTDFIGTDVFTYTICDDGNPVACDETTVTIVVNGVNADNDQTTTDQDTPVVIDILNNDEDPNGDDFTITSITDQPNNGTVVINPDGTVTYTPNSGFTGVDVFDYEICDNGNPQACDIATVTVTINPVDNEVIANDDFDITNINTPVVVAVFGNDFDPQGDTFDVTDFTQPSNGTAVYNNNGTFTYTPNADFFGTDVFTYTICDDGNPQACDVATVTIIIPAPINTVEANDDVETTLIDTPVDIPVLNNDNDNEGDDFTVTDFGQPLHGNVTYNPTTEEFTYTPDPGYTGTDVFVYTICDEGVPQACDDAVVTITIDPLPDNTVEANDDATTTEVDTPVDIEVCGNDLDAEGDNFSVTSHGQPLNGTVVYNDDCTFTYTPNPGFSGTDAFTYTICDDGNPQACDEAVVVITIEPQPDNTVEANNDEETTEVNTPVDVNVCANDIDDEGDNFTVTNFTQAQNGTVVYNNDCTFTYTPNPDFTGTDVFIYEICDDGDPQACDEAVVIITIEPQPENTVEANNDETTTEVNTPVDVEVCGNDVDAEGNNFEVTTFTQPLNGTVVYNDDCTFTYTPDPDFVGDDVFTYTICDDGNPQACDEAVVIITIEPQPENTVEANNDEETTNENTPVDVEVCANDVDAEGNNFEVTTFTQPLNGTVVYNDDCTFTYTPDPDFVGDDVFTYTICDDGNPQACDEAVVTITVIGETPVDNTVEANNDAETTEVDTPVDVEVCANDVDAEGNNFEVTTFTQPLNGTVVYNDDCTFTYTPNPDYTGTDVFTYTICDDGNPQACDEAVVIITIEPQPENTVEANNDEETTNENTPVDVEVCANDVDAEGDNFEVTTFTQPLNGTVVYNDDCTFTYTPNPGYTGTDVFTYTICDDGNPQACDEAVVVITIEPQPDNTVDANDDNTTTNENTPVDVAVCSNDVDAEGDNFEVTTFTQPLNGTVVYNDDCTFTYTPNPGYTGTDVFTYTICDDGNPQACDEAVVVITIEPQPDNSVIANNDNDETELNTPVVIDVFDNDNDPQGDNFDVTDFTQPNNGTVVYNNDGTFTYTPNQDFFGTDVFTYTICDDGSPIACDDAVVTIVIPMPNNEVVANNDEETTLPDTPVVIDILDNDFDPQGDDFTITVVDDPSNGTVTENPDGTVTYTPDPGFTGTDVFTYTICDDGIPQACDDAIVVITIEEPFNNVVATDDETTTDENTPVVIDILDNDFDPQGNDFTITVIGDPINGTVVENPDGTVTYTPDPNFVGVDSFTYTICDDALPIACDEATVVIVIEPVQNTVTATDDHTSVEVGEPVTINVCENDFDAEGNNFVVTNFTQPVHGSLVQDGCSFTYLPDPNFVGIDSFTYTICDDGNPQACDEATVVITVTPNCDANPIVINSGINCSNYSANNPFYEVMFFVSGGVAPYAYEATIPSTGEVQSGTTNGTTPATISVPNGELYEMTITDALGCTATRAELQTCSPTAVELLSFEGEVQTEGNYLQWVSASEINNDFYTLQHSIDGTNFTTIGMVDGNGNTTTAHSYNHLHKEAPAGLSYYRLLQTDFDGTTAEVGRITLLRGEVKFAVVGIYPVPATNIANISFTTNKAETVAIKVYDVAGKLVGTTTFNATKGMNVAQLDVANYAVGVYFVSLQNGNDLQTVRIVKE